MIHIISITKISIFFWVTIPVRMLHLNIWIPLIIIGAIRINMPYNQTLTWHILILPGLNSCLYIKSFTGFIRVGPAV